jgi:hypothetical protein
MTLLGTTGCGKGATIEIPNLLMDGLKHVNVISVDSAGQNAPVTYRWRSTFSDAEFLNPHLLHDLPDTGCNPCLSVESSRRRWQHRRARLTPYQRGMRRATGPSRRGIVCDSAALDKVLGRFSAIAGPHQKKKHRGRAATSDALRCFRNRPTIFMALPGSGSESHSRTRPVAITAM